jgi:hypothetical protein
MRPARFVRTMGLLLALGLAAFGGGCGPGTADPLSREESEQIRESKKSAHQQLKAEAKKVQAEVKRQTAAQKKGAHRGAVGR